MNLPPPWRRAGRVGILWELMYQRLHDYHAGAEVAKWSRSSGLQYVILAPALAPRPAGHQVTVNYTGKLTNAPFLTPAVARAIRIHARRRPIILGWISAWRHEVGENATVIPRVSATVPVHGSIPPNSVLIFEVDLLGVK